MVMLPDICLIKVARHNSLFFLAVIVFLSFFPSSGSAEQTTWTGRKHQVNSELWLRSEGCAATSKAENLNDVSQSSIDMDTFPSNLPVDEAWQQKHHCNPRQICLFYLPHRIPPRLPFGLFGTRTSRDREALILRGQGDAGTTWEAIMGGRSALGYVRLFTADLDGNGHRDAIFCFRSGGSGPPWGGPVISDNRFILLFDDRHLPVPFANAGWFEEGQNELIDFIRLPGQTGVIVLDQQPHHEHWSLKLYQAVSSRWQRLPAWPNTVAVPSSLRRQVPPACANTRDLGNDQLRPIGRLTAVNKFDFMSFRVTAVDDQGNVSCLRISEDPQGILVVSTPHHRHILFGNTDPELWKEAFLRIVKMPNTTSISGNLGPPLADNSNSPVPDELYPAIIWVSTNTDTQ